MVLPGLTGAFLTFRWLPTKRTWRQICTHYTPSAIPSVLGRCLFSPCSATCEFPPLACSWRALASFSLAQRLGLTCACARAHTHAFLARKNCRVVYAAIISLFSPFANLYQLTKLHQVQRRANPANVCLRVLPIPACDERRVLAGARHNLWQPRQPFCLVCVIFIALDLPVATSHSLPAPSPA
jgi:hypothetical protein